MKKNEFTATGRRKCSVAQVKLMPGKGNITVNGKDINEYLNSENLVMDVKQPLVLTKNENTFDVIVKVVGGGFSGQAGAIRLAIAKALSLYDADSDQTRDDAYHKVLKDNGFLTRDPRIKERKKYGLKKARRAPQFSKR
jgi:small subunit ribosomal protein S9